MFDCLPVLAISMLFPAVACGFDAAEDQAGPLKVSVVAPEGISERELPVPVRVVLENRSDHAIHGTLRLKVAEGWQSKPAEAMPFHVAGNGKAVREFTVIADQKSYAAHYSIHAFASFRWEGQQQVAHPILVEETKLPELARVTTPVAWEPFVLTADRALALWQLPSHRTVIEVFGRPRRVMPVGWTGTAETNRATVDRRLGLRLEDEKRDAIAIHPPWSSGDVGTAWIEYPLTLPESTSVKLKFATAVTPTGLGDGVTFRVRVAPIDGPPDQPGEIVFQRHSAAQSWQPAETDLSRFAGQSVRLQLESHPGATHNTTFDQSYWAEPTLIIGQPPLPATFPPETQDGFETLGTMRIGDNHYRVRMGDGKRGLLDSVIEFSSGSKRLYLRGVHARVMSMQLDDPASPVTLSGTEASPLENGRSVMHRFESPYGHFDLRGQIQIQDNALRIGFALQNAPPPKPWFAPHIEELSLAQFDQPVERVYAGHGNVIQRPGPFELTFDGHRLATSHVGFDFAGGLSLVQATDLPPERLSIDPESGHASLHATHNTTVTLVPARNVWEAAQHYRSTCGLSASGGVRRLAGRFVFDLWGGRYRESREMLNRSFRYGLTDAAVVWHNWQRWGYDYRLPEIYPPNPQWGSEQELRAMIEDCRKSDVLFALHDNYIDMYPDAEGFSYEREIAFHPDGTPVRAWLNEGREAQSYRFRADRVETWLRSNVTTIRETLAPTAYFIDVWSSIRPYDYWTADGRFVDGVFTRDTWRKQFAWIRETLRNDAPQISESGHDQLIGWLDGAQTNHLRVGKPIPGDHGWSVWDIECEDAERVPWFDFAHHDRFVLHGAGYSSRYEAGLDRRLHGIYSDDYLTTEVLTGHPAMVDQPFGHDVVRKYWLTHELMKSLALQTMTSVDFVGDDLHRQHIRWSGGGEVWVNRGVSDWQLSQHTLPQFGFLARVPTKSGFIVTAISRRDGLIVETASSPEAVYVNGRQEVASGVRIRPSVASFTSTGRELEFVLHWQADELVPDGYRPFIHFVDREGEIAFQAGFDLTRFQQQQTGRLVMPATATIAESCEIGQRFELRVGMYAPGQGGPRLKLQGPDDGERRIRLGTIELTADANDPIGTRWHPWESQADPYLVRQNPDARIVDFGAVRTSGGCRLVRQDDSLWLIPLPNSEIAGISYELDWRRLPWKLPLPTQIEAWTEDGRTLWRSSVSGNLLMKAEPDVFAFRLSGKRGDR